MADLPSTARVVIIGGGAVGTSTLYHLTKMGWTDVVLLEKNELTAGSTWHAAGNCPKFSGNWAIMQIQGYSIELFEKLGDEVGYPINYHQTGAVRLAHSVERMREFHHVADMARSQGWEMDILTNEELKAHVPQMETHDLVGGLWDKRDGDIDPSQLTQAYATGARQGGAQIIRFCPVTGIDRDGDEWIVTSDKGEIRCEYVVNAAGYYAQDIAKMFLPFGGRITPQTVLAHQYLVTEEIPELKDTAVMPMIRDPDSSYYLRQEKHGLLLGPYENGGRLHWEVPSDPRPDDFSFQLFPDDLERIEWYIEDACARVPLLGSVGLQRVINGPIPYAPDGNPLIGPMPGVPNAFEACAFTFGITQSGGAGKCMAEWIVEGETEWDTWSVDPRRFTGYADQAYSDAKGLEIYNHEYATHFHHLQWPAGRDKRLSVLHDRHTALGAEFGPFGGWERAVCYPDAPIDPADCATYEREGPWHVAVERECAAVRDTAGMIDLSGFTKFLLQGEGALDWLRTRITGGIPKVGRMSLAYFATESGRFHTEMTVIRRAEDDIMLITAAVAEWHDLDILRASLPDHLTLTPITEDSMAILVTGPKARDVLAGVVEADLSLGWLSHQTATFEGAPLDLLRVSYAGELGWELHLPNTHGVAAWDALMAAGEPHGLKPIGMYALDSLRIEKGYMGWKHDLTGDYTPFELGCDRFIKLDKPDFPGRAALQREHQQGVKQRMASLTVKANGCEAPPLASVWQNGEQVGLVTSS
ncbi:MAG: FAD-dependent oxidoreductase, partial [Pseudomonadota bacterium]